MSNGAISFSDDTEYYTPKQIIDMFGKFEYDPATTKKKAEEFGVEAYDTIETDGLKSDWTLYNSIWCNPPFTIKHEFLKKAQDYFDATGGLLYVNPYSISHDKAISFNLQRRNDILAKWSHQVSEWLREKLQKSGFRERNHHARKAMEHRAYRHLWSQI